MATRKSTPKYQVETQEGVIVFGPASKTDCKIASRGMNRKGKAPSVRIVFVKK